MFLFSVITTITGMCLLLCTESKMLLAIGVLGILSGLTTMISLTMYLIGRPRVYSFIHYYKHSNMLDNETTSLIRLTKKEVTQLYLTRYSTWFKNSPIEVDRALNTSLDAEGQTIVYGWVKATNKQEALNCLHYYTEF